MAESFYDQLASDGSYVNEVRVRRSRVMEKMPMRLFYLFIIQIVMNLISEFEMLTDAVSWLKPLAQIAAIVVVIAYGVTLLQYREYTKEYVWAFVGKIASVMYSAVTVIVYFLGISLEYDENETPVG